MTMMSFEISRKGSSFDAKCNSKGTNERKSKPRRPLTCYNIFFRYERASLLGEKIDPRSIIEGMYSDENRPRRAHRKSHGKISFKALADHVSTAWRTLSPEKKAIFQDLADEALQMYRKAVEGYETSLKESHDDSFRLPDANHHNHLVSFDSRKQSSAAEQLDFSVTSSKNLRESNDMDAWPIAQKLEMSDSVQSYLSQGRVQESQVRLQKSSTGNFWANESEEDIFTGIFAQTNDERKPIAAHQHIKAVDSNHDERLDCLVRMWSAIDPVPPGPNSLLNVDFLLG